MSFTIEQIKTAHAKVKSGADFPAYVQDLIALNVAAYETFVNDGHTLYFGKDDFSARTEAKYPEITVAENSDKEQFISDLKNHQSGETDYMTFCTDCAKSGVEKWFVDLGKMTCTYYDKSGNRILEEKNPG